MSIHSENILHAQPLSIITSAANTLSASRPGARKELLEKYIKRLENIEEIAKKLPHVKNVFILQAGREVRVFVDSQRLSDDEVYNLAKDVSAKIKQELTFPGQIKITVTKETKDIVYAS